MKYIHVYALFLMFLFCPSCKGKGTTEVINDTVSSQGPDKMVRNVKKSKDGSILIAASLAGIFRYDGKSFTNLTKNIGARRFWNVLEDRQGNIWCATTDSGVYCYNGASVRHFTTKEGLPNNSVMSIYEDRAGTIWFGTGGGGSRYDGKSFQNLTTQEGLPSNGVHTILEDKMGNFGSAQAEELVFMMERPLLFSEIMKVKLLTTFGRSLKIGKVIFGSVPRL